LILVAISLPAHASFDAFIRFNSPQNGAVAYTGESTDTQFPGSDGWSTLFSFSNDLSSPAPSNGGPPHFSPFNFFRAMDAGSTALFQTCSQGGQYGDAELILRKVGAPNTLKPFFKAKLKPAFIVSQQWSGSEGGGDITESDSVAFSEIQWTYNRYDDTGELISQTVNWSIVTGTGGFGPLPSALPVIVCPLSDPVFNTAPGKCTATALFDVFASNDAGNVPVDCEPPAGSSFKKGTTSVTCTATDDDGFSRNCAFSVVVKDTEPPAFGTISDISHVTATSTAGAVVGFTCPSAVDNCDDSVPGTCSPASGATFAPGTTTVNVSATDSSSNIGHGSFKVTVTYASSAFLSPFPKTTYKAGSSIPVKFQLTGASAGIHNLVAKGSWALLTSGVPGPYTNIGNFKFDPATGNYVLPWSTKPLAKGTYRFQADFGDGSPKTVDVILN
jgi:type VI protein secretion system component Hcp